MLEQNRSGSPVRFIAALTITALVASLITYWSTDTYEAENAILNQKVEDLQKQIDKGTFNVQADGTQTGNVQTDSAQIATLPTAAPMEIKFISCGSLQSYKTQDWYAKLMETAVKASLPVNKITNTCYSENGKIFVMVAPGDFYNCTEGAIYKYDATSNMLQQASVNGKQQKCLGWPSQFGKRENAVIKMEGPAIGEGCKVKMYFDYDFVKNIFELKKTYTTCDDKPPQWTNY